MRVVDIEVGREYALKGYEGQSRRVKVVDIKRDFTAPTKSGGKSTGLWVEVTSDDGCEYVKPALLMRPWPEEVDRRMEIRQAAVERMQLRDQAAAMSRTLRDALQLNGFPAHVNANGLGGRITVSMDMVTANRMVSWLADHRGCQSQV